MKCPDCKIVELELIVRKDAYNCNEWGEPQETKRFYKCPKCNNEYDMDLLKEE